VNFGNNIGDLALYTLLHPELRYYSVDKYRKGMLIDRLSEGIGYFSLSRILSTPQAYRKAVSRMESVADELGYGDEFGEIIVSEEKMANNFDCDEFVLIEDTMKGTYAISRAAAKLVGLGDDYKEAMSINNLFLLTLIQAVCRHTIRHTILGTFVVVHSELGDVLVDEDKLWTWVGENQ